MKLDITPFEFHVDTENKTWGFTLLMINGRSLVEVWKGTLSLWVEVFFFRVFESDRKYYDRDLHK